MTTTNTHMKLSKDQKDKLLNRNNLDAKVRRDNEFAVRERLRSFLEFIPDANSILYNLPTSQLQKSNVLKDVLNEWTIYGLFDLLFQLLNLLNFGQASGTPQKPIVVVDGYEIPLTCIYAPPRKYDEPFDFAKEQAKIDYSSCKAKSPIVKKMTYEDLRRIKTINIYIRELVSHFQSDPILFAKIYNLWRDHAREGEKTNLEPSVKDRMIIAMENAGISPEEYNQHMK